ncbi:MAG: hypothetical protein WBN38_08275 [Polyangiales bacterium]
MSTRLREAAIDHLRSLKADGGEGAVRRLSLDVEVNGQVETVILSLRGQELLCISSDGRSDGHHVSAALRFIAGLEEPEDSLHPRPSSSPSIAEEPRPLSELAEALDDLLTAITRVGVKRAQYAPSVDAALERLIETAPTPTPSGLGRFVGRLRRELLSENPVRTARILEGAARLVEALRNDAPLEECIQRIDTWLGARAGVRREGELLYDRAMVEVGREWLSGAERASIERRYLVDVKSGAVFREDRPRNAVASLGPCPRELHVGLAEVEAGPPPRRIRVLQYEVEPQVSAETWERLNQIADRSFAQVTDRYRRALAGEPALTEPFALIKPYRIERNGVFKAFDPEGHQLVLDRTERRGAVLAFYDLLAEGVEPSWLAGRLTDTGATVCLTPFAVGTQDGRYVRL